MGLQSNLSDVSSDSIPLMLLALIAGCVNNLRFFLLRLLHGSSHQLDDGTSASAAISSGLANLIVLAEQLNINRLFSYRYRCGGGGGDESCDGSSDCVVCLCRLVDGDLVRRLDCRHVFHKDCFDGWLDQCRFDCPICRSPLVSDESVKMKEQIVGRDLISCFPLH